MTDSRAAVGRRGEDIAATFLVDAGYVLIERNWRGTRGELDIVAWHGEEIVVVEVKTRTGLGFGHPAEAITADKLARLKRLAGQWLTEHAPRAASIRIDVLAVILDPTGAARVEHITGIS
ncbi:putative endonuclease [Sanguibacter gelidistatuariae]|uniref:UPF0102 protein SAMN05216410_2161 n=1 Tax=Sanguibacter gelidistatuariae TaxID=1814289 RepID=A0A1G6NIY2_9MICO|nr:YraN family protein [Sanguibacter gelidistatuariae]SDC67950.1 putative endonuclease [Sanguibacter gelidistatuariae]